jgi:hypothetical protein
MFDSITFITFADDLVCDACRGAIERGVRAEMFVDDGHKCYRHGDSQRELCRATSGS